MDMSPTRKLCQNLIASAIRRCCVSNNICRLCVILKTCPEFDPPFTRIAIPCEVLITAAHFWSMEHMELSTWVNKLHMYGSRKKIAKMLPLPVSDTGVGSCLTEFQNVDYAKNQISAENWGTTDKEVYHYRLNLKETTTSKKLTRLPSTPKRGRNFSGTEVSLTTHEDVIPWITRLCQKKVAVELLVEHMNNSGTRCEQKLQANDAILLPSSLSNIERLASGLEEFVLRHGNVLDKERQDCLLSRENLKIGRGAAGGGEGAKGTPQMMEAVVIITGPKSSNPPSSLAHGTSTKVLYFHNFSPCSISQSCLNALTSIDWQNYGLTLRDHSVGRDDDAVLQWEELPFDHFYIALHSYHTNHGKRHYQFGQPTCGLFGCVYFEVTMLQAQQRNVADKNLAKKAVKLALDDLKTRYPGLLLSPNALKIQRYAPDLSKAIAGLISSSNDLEFQVECASLLGLDRLDINEQGKIESCITDKLMGIITMNDCKSSKGKLHGPRLFDDNASQKEDSQDEGDDENRDGSTLIL